MEQMIFLWGLGAVLVLGFLFYPRAMFGLLGSLARGLFRLIADCVALLFAWI